MPQVGFKPTIPVFELAKTVHAATVMGNVEDNLKNFPPPQVFLARIFSPATVSGNTSSVNCMTSVIMAQLRMLMAHSFQFISSVTSTFSVRKCKEGDVVVRLSILFAFLQLISAIILGFVGNVLAFCNQKRLKIRRLSFKPHDLIYKHIHFCKQENIIKILTKIFQITGFTT
jgi:hypothetical protein